MPLLALAFAFAVQIQTPLLAIDVRRLALSAPARIAELSADDLKGDPDRLAWSPDGRRLYVRIAKTDRFGNQRVWHYELQIGDNRLRAIDREPDWYGRYWNWKSGLSAPATPGFRIAVETRQERRTATGVVSAGAMALTGGDPSLGAELGPQGQAIASIAMQAQMVTTTTLTLKGQLIGQFVNATIVAGLTFGWAPAAMDAIAYVNRKGRLVIMDRAGRNRDVSAGKNIVLPAWSEDGRRLVWSERSGKKLAILVADVAAK